RLIDRNQKRWGHHFPCASHPCGEINLGVKRDRCDRRWRFLRRVEDESFLPTGKHLLCPLARRSRAHSQMPAAHFQAPGGHRLFKESRTKRARVQSRERARQRRWRRNRDAQKQRTSPSACARLRSLIAALACSGDWNMAPNRPGTCERLKTASAAT